METKVLTLVFMLRGKEVCLGYKKRGFGADKWNGFGGKLESGETTLAAAVRELAEEAQVMITEESLDKRAEFEFSFPDGTNLLVHTFFVTKWEGEPAETEEMRPAWFNFNEIPFESMWADDQHWLPRALSGEKLLGQFSFTEDGSEIIAMDLNRTDSF